MPFNALMLTCLIPKKSFEEHGKKVSVCPQSDEAVFFFVIDEQSNPRSSIRQDLPLNGEICDLIVYYVKKQTCIMCFVELKGKEASQAIKQVINTKKCFEEALRQALKDKACRKDFRTIQWKAYILYHGSSSKDLKKYKDDLVIAFGKNNYKMESGIQTDIGQFLRG